MPFAKLLDDFHSNPKVILAGLEGAGLYARSLSFCGAYLTDGFIPTEWAKTAAGRKQALLQKLCAVGLWEKAPGGYKIPDFLEFNPSKAQFVELQEKKAAAGKKGAMNRWHGSKRHNKSHDTSQDESDGTSDSKTMAPRAGALPREEALKDLPKGRAVARPPSAYGLPFSQELIVQKILEAVGADSDNGTPQVVRRYASHLPESSLAKVLESVASSRKRNKAQYVVGALKSECEERGITV